MREFVAVAAYAALFLLYIFIFRGTVFEVSPRRGRYGGLFVLRESFLLILLGALLLEVYGLDDFKMVYVTEYSVHETTFFVFFAVAMLFCSMSLFSKTIFRSYLTWKASIPWVDEAQNDHSAYFVRAVALVLVTLVGYGLSRGMSHAFFEAIFSGESLIRVRLANRYESSVPSHVIAYLRYSFLLLAILSGLLGARGLHPLERYAYLGLSIYAATLLGDKAPLAQVLLLYFIGMVIANRYSAAKVFLASGFFVLFLLSVIYFSITVQYPDMTSDEFMLYLSARLGVGQIQGVYEQFALQLRDWKYILIEVPFSGFFSEPPDFSKDLMLATLGYYSHANDVGVMNSFFIGEALAIGGYPLAVISPVLIGLNFCLICAVVVVVIVRFFRVSPELAKTIAPLFTSGILMFTGDLNGLLMLKKLFVVLIYFALVYCVFEFLRSLWFGFLARR